MIEKSEWGYSMHLPSPVVKYMLHQHVDRLAKKTLFEVNVKKDSTSLFTGIIHAKSTFHCLDHLAPHLFNPQNSLVTFASLAAAPKKNGIYLLKLLQSPG